MATLQMVKSMMNTALDTALITVLSLFDDISNGKLSKNNVKDIVCTKFNDLISDSGVKNNLFGKARTIDYALQGDLNSVCRNENWMSNVETVAKLDADVNSLRMLCSARGIKRDTRVLKSCFSVSYPEGKSSSIIKCNQLFFEKIVRGEISIDTEIKTIDPILIDDFDNAMKDVENCYNDMKCRYDELFIKCKEYEDRIADLIETNNIIFEQCKEYKNKISELENDIKIKNVESEIECDTVDSVDFKSKIESFVLNMGKRIHTSNLNDKIKGHLQNKLFDLASVCEKLKPLAVLDRFDYVLDELLYVTSLVNSLAIRFNLELDYC